MLTLAARGIGTAEDAFLLVFAPRGGTASCSADRGYACKPFAHNQLPLGRI